MTEVAPAPVVEVEPVAARPRVKGAHRAPKGEAPTRRTRSKDAGRHRRLRPNWPWWQEIPVLLVIAVVAAYVVKTFLLQVFFIPSESMENTLLRNDRVLVDKVTGGFSDVQRGQIVVFNADGVLASPAPAVAEGSLVQRAASAIAGALGLGQTAETDYIKRVIGLPGDRVVCCDDVGRVTVNGVPLDESAYLFPGDVPSLTTFDVVVPADRMWVMGDHRSASQDSRSRIGAPGGGFVPLDRIVGRAFVRSWPLDRLGTLPIPDTFDQPAIDQNREPAP
jgi:signal peptidase I